MISYNFWPGHSVLLLCRWPISWKFEAILPSSTPPLIKLFAAASCASVGLESGKERVSFHLDTCIYFKLTHWQNCQWNKFQCSSDCTADRAPRGRPSRVLPARFHRFPRGSCSRCPWIVSCWCGNSGWTWRSSCIPRPSCRWAPPNGGWRRFLGDFRPTLVWTPLSRPTHCAKWWYLEDLRKKGLSDRIIKGNTRNTYIGRRGRALEVRKVGETFLKWQFAVLYHLFCILCKYIFVIYAVW